MPTHPSSAPDRRVRHLRAVLESPSPLDRYRAHPPRRAVLDGVILLEAGSPNERHHHAIVLGPVSQSALLSHARDFYGTERLDSVELVAELATSLEESLRERGWQLDEEEPALLLDPAPESLPPPPAELTIRRALDESAFEHFFSISEAGRSHIPSLEAARDPRVALLVGYVQDHPVATARLSAHGETADLMGIVTHPDHRRRGYGAAMTRAAIRTAQDMGCRAFLLTATEMGYPLYRKLGFQPLCTMRTYEPAGAR